MFSFITSILEPKNDASTINYSKLKAYYLNNIHVFNLQENKGAGTQSGQVTFKPKKLIKTVGLPKKYGKVLYHLISTNNCKTILELGTSVGVSTTFLIHPEIKQQIISVEGNENIYTITKKAFTALKFDKVELKNAMFDDVLLDCCKQLKQIDFVFIDGNHKMIPTIQYFETIKPFLNENSIVVFDDIYWNKEMKETWQQICSHKDVQLSIDLFRMGIVFFNKTRKEKEHFTLWY